MKAAIVYGSVTCIHSIYGNVLQACITQHGLNYVFGWKTEETHSQKKQLGGRSREN